MYLHLDVIREALIHLENVDTFYGTTFLVFKAAEIPVGKPIEFAVGAAERLFLEQYYKPLKSSRYYYRVFRTSDRDNHWLTPKFPGGGSQSIRTRGAIAQAFIHPRKSKLWGWHPDYLQVLKSELYNQNLIPAFYLAVWLYRERAWDPHTTAENILTAFLEDFNITPQEEQELFDTSIPEEYSQPQSKLLFQDHVVQWQELREIIGDPPDVIPDERGTLSYLELIGVGPAEELSFEPSERINLITGDNGLGKTFILECVWWALTGYWAGLPAYPREDARRAQIIFQIKGQTSKSIKKQIAYDFRRQTWPIDKGRPTIPGLLIYARVDGSFAVWDPARVDLNRSVQIDDDFSIRPYVFTETEIWDGKKEGGARSRYLSNGLIIDWIKWQYNSENSPFETLKRVLARLAPREMGSLEPDEPTRLPFDSRDIPTIRFPYGRVPIVHAAAGMRRILSLAYLIVWAWEEHKKLSELARQEPQRRMVILIDEIEAHLHPQWQRLILPALVEAREELSSDLQVQYLIATHSPLVMASVEPMFSDETDKQFHLDLVQSEHNMFSKNVVLQEMAFVRHGNVNSWLTSDVFELDNARSVEAENAIKEAKQLQLSDNPTTESVQRVSEMLVRYLSADDEFWPRWTYFAEQYGVEL